MSFGEAVKTCFSKLFVFQGRARRSEFWYFYLFMTLISFAVSIVFFVLLFAAMIPMLSQAGNTELEEGAFFASFGAFFVVYGLFYLVMIAISVMMLGAMARRLHDMGQSGHWLWLNLAGLGIVPLIMCIMEGEPHANQWGPDPKANERGFVAHAPVAYPPAPTGQSAAPVDGDPFATQK